MGDCESDALNDVDEDGTELEGLEEKGRVGGEVLREVNFQLLLRAFPGRVIQKAAYAGVLSDCLKKGIMEGFQGLFLHLFENLQSISISYIEEHQNYLKATLKYILGSLMINNANLGCLANLYTVRVRSDFSRAADDLNLLTLFAQLPSMRKVYGSMLNGGIRFNRYYRERCQSNVTEIELERYQGVLSAVTDIISTTTELKIFKLSNEFIRAFSIGSILTSLAEQANQTLETLDLQGTRGVDITFQKSDPDIVLHLLKFINLKEVRLPAALWLAEGAVTTPLAKSLPTRVENVILDGVFPVGLFPKLLRGLGCRSQHPKLRNIALFIPKPVYMTSEGTYEHDDEVENDEIIMSIEQENLAKNGITLTVSGLFVYIATPSGVQ